MQHASPVAVVESQHHILCASVYLFLGDADVGTEQFPQVSAKEREYDVDIRRLHRPGQHFDDRRMVQRAQHRELAYELDIEMIARAVSEILDGDLLTVELSSEDAAEGPLSDFLGLFDAAV